MTDQTLGIQIATPPFPDESISGFLLRLAEANGFLGIRPFFSFAMGIDAGIMPEQPRKNILTALADSIFQDISTLTSLGFREISNAQDGAVILFMEQAISSKAIRQTTAPFCPLCVAERGYIEQVWSIRAVVACPRHKIRLLYKCQCCGNAINVYRPLLLRCKCGESFLDNNPPPASAHTIMMAEAIFDKLGSPGGATTSSPIHSRIQEL